MSNENIKNPPSSDTYPIVSTLFVNKRFYKHEILINSLSLTILELIEKGHWSQEEVSYFYWEEECEKPKQISTMYALQIAEAGDRFNKLKLYHTKHEAKEGLRDEIAEMVYATAKSLFKSHKFSDKKLKKEIDSLTEEAWESIEFGGVWERISGFAFVFRTLMA